MDLKNSVVFILCLLSHGLTFAGALSVNCDSEGLTMIPGDINGDGVTDFSCERNQFTEIRQVDFNDRYPQLKVLKLSYNMITSVESGSFKGTLLTQIGLRYNQLTTLPDLREVSSTLKKIFCGYNNIIHVSPEDVSYLTALERIALNNNLLVSISDLEQILPALQLLGVTGCPLRCCSEIAWMKDTALVLKISDVPCHSPPSLTGIAWANISKELLENTPCAGEILVNINLCSIFLQFTFFYLFLPI